MLRQEADLAPLFIDFPGLDKTQPGSESGGHPARDMKVWDPSTGWLSIYCAPRWIIKWCARPLPMPLIPISSFSTCTRADPSVPPDRSSQAAHSMNPMCPLYEVDLEKANELLDKAGFTRQSDGTRFSLTLDYIPIIPTQQHDVAFYISTSTGKDRHRSRGAYLGSISRNGPNRLAIGILI